MLVSHILPEHGAQRVKYFTILMTQNIRRELTASKSVLVFVWVKLVGEMKRKILKIMVLIGSRMVLMISANVLGKFAN